MSGPDDAAVAAAVRSRVARCAGGASACPSEVARALAPDAWRPLMPRVREAARRLARAGELEITQGGRRIDPDATTRGPIRLRPAAPRVAD